MTVTNDLAVDMIRSKGHETCNHRIYGLTCESYERLLERADGRCEICAIPAEETPRGMLVIDHDGRYGGFAVRGMLCSKCNSHIGLVEAGKHKPDIRDHAYFRHAWFIDVFIHRYASTPLKTAHGDWTLWRRFGRAAGSLPERYRLIREFMNSYAHKAGH